MCSNPVLRELWACDKPCFDEFTGEKLLWNVGGVDFEKCPLRALKVEGFDEVMFLYDCYQKSFLPCEGAWSNQPEIYVNLMTQVAAKTQEVKNYIHQRQVDSAKKKKE